MTDTHETSSGSVHELAISWVTRLQSGDCTEQERYDFEVWLSQSEAHRVAHHEVAAFWSGLGQLELHAAPQLAAARAYLRDARQSRVAHFPENVWREFYPCFL